MTLPFRLLPWLVEDNFTSDGFVRVLIECVNQTDEIVLHAYDLQVDRESVKVINVIIDITDNIQVRSLTGCCRSKPGPTSAHRRCSGGRGTSIFDDRLEPSDAAGGCQLHARNEIHRTAEQGNDGHLPWILRGKWREKVGR